MRVDKSNTPSTSLWTKGYISDFGYNYKIPYETYKLIRNLPQVFGDVWPQCPSDITRIVSGYLVSEAREMTVDDLKKAIQAP